MFICNCVIDINPNITDVEDVGIQPLGQHHHQVNFTAAPFVEIIHGSEDQVNNNNENESRRERRASQQDSEGKYVPDISSILYNHMYTYIYIYTHIYIYTYTYTYTYTHTYTYTYTCIINLT